MKLKTTEDYLLLIDEEAEIYQMDLYLDVDYDTVTRATLTSDQYEGCKKIIAYYPLTKEAKELDLPLLPNPFEEEPLMKQASKLRELRGYHKDNHYSFCGGFIEGYKAAQSKQFSLEDMKNILEEGLNWFGGGRDKEIRDSETWFNHYIQSLFIQRLPKEFISEYEYKENLEAVKELKNMIGITPRVAKIIKVLKTIINSEGKEEIQGTYKY